MAPKVAAAKKAETTLNSEKEQKYIDMIAESYDDDAPPEEDEEVKIADEDDDSIYRVYRYVNVAKKGKKADFKWVFQNIVKKALADKDDEEDEPEPEEDEPEPEPEEDAEPEEAEPEPEEEELEPEPQPQPKPEQKPVKKAAAKEKDAEPKPKKERKKSVKQTKTDMEHDVNQAMANLADGDIESAMALLKKLKISISKISKRRASSGDDGEKKPRARSAYNVFISKKITEMANSDPEIPSKDRMREAVKMWNALSDDEKKVLREEHEKLKNAVAADEE